MRRDKIAGMSARLHASVRAVVAVLVATVLRLSAAAVMPLAMVPVPPAVVDGGYARFVATFGPDASLCTAMPGTADERGSQHDGPARVACPTAPSARSAPACATHRQHSCRCRRRRSRYHSGSWPWRRRVPPTISSPAGRSHPPSPALPLPRPDPAPSVATGIAAQGRCPSPCSSKGRYGNVDTFGARSSIIGTPSNMRIKNVIDS